VFTRPGFEHCWAFRQVGERATLVLNPHLHRIEIELAPYDPWEVIDHAKAKGCRVLVVKRQVSEYDPARHGRVGRGVFLTCASLLSYLIGANFSWQCTPYQLFRTALKHGAEEV